MSGPTFDYGKAKEGEEMITNTGDATLDHLLHEISDGIREGYKVAADTESLHAKFVEFLTECNDAVWNWG